MNFTPILSLAFSLLLFSTANAASFYSYHYDPGAESESITYAPSLTSDQANSLRMRTQTNSNAAPRIQKLRTDAALSRFLPQRGSLIARRGHEERPYYQLRRSYSMSAHKGIYNNAYKACLADLGEASACTFDTVMEYMNPDADTTSKGGSLAGQETRWATAFARRTMSDGIRYQDENSRTQVKTGLQKLSNRFYTGGQFSSSTGTQQRTSGRAFSPVSRRCTYNAATAEHTCQMYNPEVSAE